MHDLILTDQEGGQVRRLSGAPPLSERQIGRAQIACRRHGAPVPERQSISECGIIDVNLAPVLDVFRQPGDFIDDFQRSYSNDRGAVAELGGAFIRPNRAGGSRLQPSTSPGWGQPPVGRTPMQVRSC